MILPLRCAIPSPTLAASGGARRLALVERIGVTRPAPTVRAVVEHVLPHDLVHGVRPSLAIANVQIGRGAIALADVDLEDGPIGVRALYVAPHLIDVDSKKVMMHERDRENRESREDVTRARPEQLHEKKQ